MRKTLSIVLSLLMVLSIFAPVFAEEEVTAENIAKNEEFIEFLKEQKIIEGDKSGNLMLEENIDRASFAAILVRADGKDAVAKSVATLPSKFADMTAAHWANGYATVAHDNLWMKGDPQNNFMPGKSISYAEIATTLVRFMGEEKDGMVYPTSYIAKATELGLFKGTEEIAGEYTKNAVRRNVFMMLYNALSREDFGKYNVYEMIVLENDRVATIKAGQLKAEVLSVVQMANNVNERGVAKIGQQMVFDLEGVKVENGLVDTEYLLGKVAKFTVDENGKLVKVVVDHKNYDYKYGELGANPKYVNINGVDYSVRIDERYYNRYEAGRYDRDDRMYRTYLHTDKGVINYNYEAFAKDVVDKKVAANFGRITVKDGMVLFVDAYDLQDIAPVQRVERDGKDVYYYNDVRDAAIERMTPANTVIGFTAKDGFRNIDKKDIKADDVIHWMNGFTLVRQDATIQANLVKTYIDKWGEWATLKAGEKEDAFYLNSYTKTTPPFNSVYAYDDEHFRTLRSRALINDMVGADVKVLLDINNGIQLITSHEKFADQLALVDKAVSAKGMQFLLPNAPEEVKIQLTDNWGSMYYRRDNKFRSTATNRFDDFNRLDLAYTSADKDGNAKVVATIDGFEYLYNNDFMGQFAGHPWAAAEFDKIRDFVRVGGKDYRYTDETDVFVINVHPITGVRDYVIQKITLADVKKYNEKNADLMAAVLTEKEYSEFLNKLRIPTWGRFDGDRDDFAKAIVFTNYVGPQADLEKAEIGRIARVDNYANVVEIEVARGLFEEFEIEDYSLVNFRAKDLVGRFVEFKRVKKSDPKAARFLELIDATDAGKVGKRTGYSIEVNGTTYKTDKNTKEFGDSRWDYAWVYVNNGYADLIVFTKNDPTPAVAKDTGVISEVGNKFIKVDGKVVYFTTERTILRNAKGEILKVGNLYNSSDSNLVGSQIVVETNDKNEAIEIRIVNTKADLSLEKAKARFAQTKVNFAEKAMPVTTEAELKAAKKAVAKVTAPEADSSVLTEKTEPKFSEYDKAERNLATTKAAIEKYEKENAAKADLEKEAAKLTAIALTTTEDLMTQDPAAAVKAEAEKMVDLNKVEVTSATKEATGAKKHEATYTVLLTSKVDNAETKKVEVTVTTEKTVSEKNAEKEAEEAAAKKAIVDAELAKVTDVKTDGAPAVNTVKAEVEKLVDLNKVTVAVTADGSDWKAELTLKEDTAVKADKTIKAQAK